MAVIDEIRALKAAGAFARTTPLFGYAQALGMVLETEGTRLHTRLRFRPDHIGNTTLPALHGGVVAGVLEHAALMEFLWRHDCAALPRIVSRTIQYLRPAGELDLVASAEVIKCGRRTGHVAVEAWQERADRPVAAGAFNLLLSEPS